MRRPRSAPASRRPSRLGLAVVRGRSMSPTLRDGDRLLVRYAAPPRPGQVRGGALRRRCRRRQAARPPRPDGWWVTRDNPREGRDSWSAGAVAEDGCRSRVVLAPALAAPGTLVARRPGAGSATFGARRPVRRSLAALCDDGGWVTPHRALATPRTHHRPRVESASPSPCRASLPGESPHVVASEHMPDLENPRADDPVFALHAGGKMEVASRVALNGPDELSLAYTPGRGAGVPGDRRRARARRRLHLGREHRGGGHRRHRRPRARRHRAAGRDAGDGGQGRAVQAVRRRRRRADLPRHRRRRRDRRDRGPARAQLRRRQPRGHLRPALLRDRGPAQASGSTSRSSTTTSTAPRSSCSPRWRTPCG